MNKIILFVLVSVFSVSCATQRIAIRDYSEQMRILENGFPEIYDLYRQGAIVLDDVYRFEKDGELVRFRVLYHYR